MKCPKCGYISFDSNDVCPKCKKNIAAERDHMNLPAFRAMPPSMLGGLVGEENDADVDVKIQESDDTSGMELDVSLSPEDSQAIEAMEQTFKDSQDFEIQLETALEEEGDVEAEPETVAMPGIRRETPEPKLQSRNKAMTSGREDDIEEISLDLEDLPSEDFEIDLKQTESGADKEGAPEPAHSASGSGGIEETADLEPPEMDDEGIFFDLDELTRNEPDTISVDSIHEKPDDEVTIDLEGLASAVEGNAEDLSKPVKSATHEAEDLSLDIEDLDLNLELEDPIRKTS
jgi:hypothetical protein